ncbi:lipase/acyltransferase domain-containing protein [Poseidonibacter lekithochrous]|uniref:lipase/acyltransferase domain-containing protein n=1 Tax=Poseidonibacter lekithochrous TaxID=1904463 RepID=UPI000D38D2CD|nr:DUF413 domain-containing protein [Poseidonibacter lekithochrous]
MIKVIFLNCCLILILTSCSYIKYSSIQANYSKIQKSDPSQVNLKHMIDRETFFVLGKTIDKTKKYSNRPMAIAAYSSKFRKNERVDTMFIEGTETYYGLTLPEGTYTLLIYADINQDQIFQQSEIVGKKELILNTNKFPERIVKHKNIELTNNFLITWAETIPLPKKVKIKQSLYYPTGTIRSLTDPIFDERISTMGMYDPASFMKAVPTMFYATQEDVSHKIPVVFVHGIGGSPRQFNPIIKHIDKDRYKLWFFYYPSGGDLDQLSDLFYTLFLSGDVISLGKMPLVVVAHSMGGLVVRKSFNKYEGNTNENKVELFVSIASPFGGHPAAESGEKYGLIVLPSWKDLNPNNQFIKELYKKQLPKFVNHQLFYAYKNPSILKVKSNNDGVVPLSSQLHSEAQMQSQNQFGFNSSHNDILENKNMIDLLLKNMAGVQSKFPKSHMKILENGGFNVKLDDKYSPHTKYLINYAGRYIMLLVNGMIEPISPQQKQFIQVLQGKKIPTNDVEKEFIQFMKEYSKVIETVLNDK